MPIVLSRPRICELRNLTRYRKAQVEERTREVQRLDKVLQDAGVKLSSVAGDLLGKSGRDMLAALDGGTRDPEVLAELARGRLRAKLPALRQALRGRFGAHHGLLAGQVLAKLDFLDEAIEALSAEIGRVVAPYAAQVALLDTIPGVDRRTAEALTAELGVDMARFGSAARLASWAGMCPGQHESAGKQRSGKTRKGPKWLGAHLTEAAKAAGRTKDTYLSAQYQRLRGRRGTAKATKAVGHSILVAAYHILDRGVPYHDSALTGSCAAAPRRRPASSSASSTPSATRSPSTPSRRPDHPQPRARSHHGQAPGTRHAHTSSLPEVFTSGQRPFRLEQRIVGGGCSPVPAW